MLLEFILSCVWSCIPFILILFIVDYIARVSTLHNVNVVGLLNSEQPSLLEGGRNSNIIQCNENTVKSVNDNTADQADLSTIAEELDAISEELDGSLWQENAIRLFDVNWIMSKYYIVNESVFMDSEVTMADDEQYHDYSLYKVMRTEPAIDDHDVWEESDDDNFNEVLDTVHDIIRHGRVINNNVYVSHEQWHTVRQIHDDLYSCAVCQMQCDAASIAGHMSSESHARNLNDKKPLKKFDLSITRMIHDNFHCAVCNIVYPFEKYRDHENSKEHEGNLLFAINKVSDLSNLLLTGNGVQSVDRNNIQPPNNQPNSQHYNQMSYQMSVSNRDQNTSTIADRDHTTEMSKRDLDTFTNIDQIISTMSNRDQNTPTIPNWNQTTSPMLNREQNTSTMSNREQTTAMTERENSYFNRDEEVFRFGSTAFNNITIYEEEDFEEYVPPIEGISYASMASRPRVEMPKYLKIDLGDKYVRVQFESWHMITQTDLNNYYCMACQSGFHIRFKHQHCLDEKHGMMLANCGVVGAFEDYLIRDVSDKLYHCGHCNNLQFKNDMRVHVEQYHSRNNRSKSIPMEKTPNNDTIIHIETNATKNINLQTIVQTNLQTNLQKNVQTNLQTPQKIDIFGEFKFAPFGSEMAVSNLGCHTLMVVNNRYNCALCDVYIDGDLIEHVYKVTHMQLMNMTPFIKPFKSNLTRAVRGSLHCALCNILIPVNRIYDHNIESAHTTALAKSLGMTKNQRPYKEVKYNFEHAIDTKSELDKFLNTLPSTSRGALNNIKIKNPSGEMVSLSSSTSSSTSPVCDVLNRHPSGPNIDSKTVNQLNPIVNLPAKLHLQTGQLVSLNIDKPDCNSPIQLKIAGPVDSNGAFSQVRVQPVRLADVERELLSGYNQKVDHTENNKEIERKEIKDDETEKKECKIRKSKKDSFKLFDSDEEDILQDFKLDETVIIKLKSSYFKITNTSYHTLIHVGNGTRYCFVCSNTLDYCMLQKHVDSREHVENIAKNKYLLNFFGVQLFRQMYLMYHCAICNVVMTRKEVKIHLEWPTHIQKYDNSCKKLGKKVLKDMLKSGAKEITVETQKEHVYLKSDSEPTMNVVTYIQTSKHDFVEPFVAKKFVKKSRMIILKGNVMKICFESWHGVLVTKNGTKCIICQLEMKGDELEDHIDTKYHNIALGITFEKNFYPALIRKINESTVNCVICNVELASDESLVHEHLNGRKHDKNYSAMINTSNSDSYADCYEDPLTL